jgi:hypothetical protein
MLRFRKQSGSVIVASVLLAVLGCSDGVGITDPSQTASLPPTIGQQCGDWGTFAGNAAGAVRATMSGCAGFVVSAAANNSELFGLLLSDGAITSNIHRVYITGISSRLEIGEYTIGNGAFSGVFTSAVNPEVFSVMPDQRSFALRGTLTITSSSSAMLSGSVDVTGTDANGAEVAVTGSFTAKCVAASGAVC